MNVNAFTKEEIYRIRDKAWHLSETEGMNILWANAFWELTMAADRIGAMLNRSNVIVYVSTPDEPERQNNGTE